MDVAGDEAEDTILLCALLLQCTAALAFAVIWKQRNRLTVRGRRYGVHPINARRNVAGHYNNLYFELREDPERFFKYTRMSLAQFDLLLHLIEPKLPPKDNFRHKPMPAALRLAVTLRYLATGDNMYSIACAYRIGESTARLIIHETCTAIWEALSPIYLKAPTPEDFEQIAEEYWLKWHMPNCLGSLDGKHIRVKAPIKSGSMNYCYKGFFSVVLMAACDANYCFTLVDIGHVGSLSDGGVFRSCPFGQQIIDNTMPVPPPSPLPGTDYEFPYYFVGDEAFALKPNLLIPFGRDHLKGRDEVAVRNKVFNYRLSRARRVIENSFGILAARWRIFHKTLEASEENVVGYVQATVCLHNFLMKTKDIGFRCVPGANGDEVVNGIQIQGEWRTEEMGTQWQWVPLRSNRNPNEYGKRYRDSLAHYLTHIGVFRHQFQYVNRGVF